jgi:hypothetical protein
MTGYRPVKELIMPLTRGFRETVHARASADVRFRQALLGETTQALLDGNLEEGLAALRSCITPPLVSKNWASCSADRRRA